MTKFLVCLMLLCSFNVSAKSNTNFSLMTKKEQFSEVEDIAKDLRRSRYIEGHEDVSSSVELVEKKWLEEYTKKESNRRYENPLYSDEIAELFQCFYGETCQLFYIGMSSSYWGGYGDEGHFVLLYTQSKKHHMIGHVLYTE